MITHLVNWSITTDTYLRNTARSLSTRESHRTHRDSNCNFLKPPKNIRFNCHWSGAFLGSDAIVRKCQPILVPPYQCIHIRLSCWLFVCLSFFVKPGHMHLPCRWPRIAHSQNREVLAKTINQQHTSPQIDSGDFNQKSRSHSSNIVCTTIALNRSDNYHYGDFQPQLM